MAEIMCGHITDGNGFTFICNRPTGHKGFHAETVRLRDGKVSTTNWGDDGLAAHSTKYPENGSYRPMERKPSTEGSAS